MFSISKKIISNFCVFSLSLALFSAANALDYKDKAVVTDSNNNIVKSTYNDCVYTKWENSGTNCQEGEAAPVKITDRSPSAPKATSRSFLVFFDFDSASLTKDGKNIIDNSLAKARAGNFKYFKIIGHTDSIGSERYNNKLSERRALSVKKYLTDNNIKATQIEILAKGENDLLIPTADGVLEPQNRRVEFIYTY